MLRIIQDQRNLSKAHLGALGRAAEDHILHLGAPKVLGALLAHDPADRVGNIRFSGAVGTDDGGNILGKVQNRFLREGLKSLDLQSF